MANNQNQNKIQNEGQGQQGVSRQQNQMGGMFPGLPGVFSDFLDMERFFPSMPSMASMMPQMSPMMQQMRQQPAVNIIENDNEFRVEVSAPGMRKDDFNIDMEENRLTISAERKYEHEEKSGGGNGKESKNNERYTRREFGYSQFSRSFMLPETVDPEKIDASYQDGVLKLILPKREEEKQRRQRRQINIK